MPYELNEQTDAPSTASGPLPQSAKTPANRGDEDEVETYELNLNDDEAAASPPALERLRADPRSDGAVETEDETPAAAPAPDRAVDPAAARPTPLIHSTEQPKYVNPEVAARKREEARTRGAAQAALDAQRITRRNWIIAACVLLAVAVALFALRLL